MYSYCTMMFPSDTKRKKKVIEFIKGRIKKKKKNNKVGWDYVFWKLVRPEITYRG